MNELSALATDERSARMVLANIVEPGDILTGRVLAHAGAVETVRALTEEGTVPGMGEVEARLWRSHLPRQVDTQQVAETTARAEREGFGTLIPGDRDFPTSLDDLGVERPYLLWVKGHASLLSGSLDNRFTITGSRDGTAYGVEVAGGIAADLARDEKIVVSGGGFGIDAAAHRAALMEAGHTIAVIASTGDRPHAGLLERIADVGLVVSETPPGSPPTRTRVLARARIEAALSAATTVVESGPRSSALAVAARAHELGRGVGAVPGSVLGIMSSGTNALLCDGTARAVTNANDITELGATPTANRQPPRPCGYGTPERRTLKAHRPIEHRDL
ncbi:DNA-processing protein DprA [Aeromicrobium piscarium]|uniref:DNA processing protein DprA n=1 Tax=Aeromicrobium piscarium TaxID=2590901 RepID=A0A554RVN4_9ACTN|nr:DNA-processing protein DprA [Aeromicrobium piscarium]TSD58164.1 DNA processing protein DprA [Aeromicrobium piscarium]